MLNDLRLIIIYKLFGLILRLAPKNKDGKEIITTILNLAKKQL